MQLSSIVWKESVGSFSIAFFLTMSIFYVKTPSPLCYGHGTSSWFGKCQKNSVILIQMINPFKNNSWIHGFFKYINQLRRYTRLYLYKWSRVHSIKLAILRGSNLKFCILANTAEVSKTGVSSQNQSVYPAKWQLMVTKF